MPGFWQRRGIQVKASSHAACGAVMLLVYEYTYSWLQENW
ncbi:hypothetical protein D623_10021694 [Myotis brandtii]|uniref:Uncharacterized protein n=1 Tax=Myotis brandtii TaxID=109478 RepID=S7MRF8_MYOBR|nr:hypothetical protein D623_10021694 [Myotis brandtii]